MQVCSGLYAGCGGQDVDVHQHVAGRDGRPFLRLVGVDAIRDLKACRQIPVRRPREGDVGRRVCPRTTSDAIDLFEFIR